jgi:hypothetical protein
VFEGTEFGSGALAGNQVVSAFLFFIALILTFKYQKTASVIALVACYFSLPLYLYLVFPRPCRRVWPGEWSVAYLPREIFVWNGWVFPPLGRRAFHLLRGRYPSVLAPTGSCATPLGLSPASAFSLGARPNSIPIQRHLYPRLGRKEDSTPPGSGVSASRFRLEAVEQGMAVWHFGTLLGVPCVVSAVKLGSRSGLIGLINCDVKCRSA